MSTRALYQVLGTQGYRVEKVQRDEGLVQMHLEPLPHRVCCPVCKGKNVIRRGEKARLFRNLPIGKNCTWLIVNLPRVECRDCEVVRQIDLGIADPMRTYTRAFERYVLELSRYMIILDVARHLDVSWDIVKDIQKRNLVKRYSKPKLKKVKQIAIDEICIGKGHRYLTIVLDLQSGAILFVGEGKSAASLAPFWKRLKASRAKVQAAAIDMSPAYQAALAEHLPQAKIVFDRFHVVKLLNEKLSELRRELYREATDGLKKQVLKGTRWLLLKRSENLDPKRKEPQRLQKALRLNESLAIAYYLKEDLGQLWEQTTKQQARRHLQDWYDDAMDSGIRVLQTFARTLLAHQDGILAWYDYPISTGPLEGTNNKIKTLNRQHYGLRDKQFFTLKLYQLHETKYALVG